jgi:hydroxymethylglutaryl-CoA reductase
MRDRLERVSDHASLSRDERNVLSAASALPDDTADTFIENAVGGYPLPLGFAVGFAVDSEDVVVPMAVEESSVIAAACKGAKLAAKGGGFTTKSMRPVMIGQIEVRDVKNAKRAVQRFEQQKSEWMEQLNREIPGMVRRGGGVRDLVLRQLADSRFVIHVLVDTQESMGANMVNGLCESIGDDVAGNLGGRRGLRILSNLANERLVTASCKIPISAIGGDRIARRICEANEFALVDSYRAATHNKGIMNGIDPVVIATGNDWRAVEAGAHAYAASDGHYRGLTIWTRDEEFLRGELTIPMQIGTVGGVTRRHPVAAACMKVLGSPSSERLGRIITSVGLAQNLAALRALSAEGIQEGHMRLHAGNERLDR